MSDVSGIIAWQGEVEVLGASWSLNDGRRVEFRLCGQSFYRQHPFKVFQQKRNGHVGTRFRASFARTTTGEVMGTMDLMLCGWKDSSAVGQSVIFWLDDEVEIHPFCGCIPRKGQTPGDMFAMVLVEIGDDERPVDQVRQAAVEQRSGPGVPAGVHERGAAAPGAGEAPPPDHDRDERPNNDRQPARRKLSSAAHLLVTSPMFTQYLKETKPNLVKVWTSEVARNYAKTLIKVESLSDLDRDKAAIERWQSLVYRPYERWRSQDPR